VTEHHRLLVHTTRLPIRWGDMDALGHVNNTVYFLYMEQARMEWVTSLDVQGEAPREWTTVIVNASCTFLRPLVFPGTVEVRMLLAQPGRTSVASHYEIAQDGELYAEGAAKLVFVDTARGRPVPLPAPVTALLRPLAPAVHAAPRA
jgi:acyl-CoA thioester hydrolase